MLIQILIIILWLEVICCALIFGSLASMGLCWQILMLVIALISLWHEALALFSLCKTIYLFLFDVFFSWKPEKCKKFFRLVCQAIRKYTLWHDQIANLSKIEKEQVGRIRSVRSLDKALRKVWALLPDQYNNICYKETKRKFIRKRLVSARMLSNRIGYIRLFRFQNDLADEAEVALKKLDKAQAYILDLRGNPGGSINVVAETFSLFADSGKIVTLKGYLNNTWREECLTLLNESIKSNNCGWWNIDIVPRSNRIGSKPLVVLVDHKSASAAEILTSALHENCNALVVGMRTFGKWISQLPMDLPSFKRHGKEICLDVTFAYVYSAKNECLHEVGLKPDIQVKPSPKWWKWAYDAQLQRAKRELQAKLA